jgi:hypothetical protein
MHGCGIELETCKHLVSKACHKDNTHHVFFVTNSSKKSSAPPRTTCSLEFLRWIRKRFPCTDDISKTIVTSYKPMQNLGSAQSSNICSMISWVKFMFVIMEWCHGMYSSDKPMPLLCTNCCHCHTCPDAVIMHTVVTCRYRDYVLAKQMTTATHLIFQELVDQEKHQGCLPNAGSA